MTINEIVQNFHEVVIELVNNFARLELSWEEIDGSEDFQDMVSLIYNLSIVEVINKITNENFSETSRLPKYSFYHKDYKNLSFISVETKDAKEDSFYVFNCFNSVEEPYDIVLCNEISMEGNIIAKDIELKYSDVNFAYIHRQTKDNELLMIK